MVRERTASRLGLVLKMLKRPNSDSFSIWTAQFFLEIRQDSCVKTACQLKKSLAVGHIPIFQTRPSFFADGLEEKITAILTDFSVALCEKIRFFLCGSVDAYIALTHKTRETYQSWMVGNADPSSRTICILSPDAAPDYTREDMKKGAIHELVHLVLDGVFGCPEN